MPSIHKQPVKTFTVRKVANLHSLDNKNPKRWHAMSQALAPNIIHSFDASIILKFANALIYDNHISFYLIHDTVYFPLYYTDKIWSLLSHTYYDIFVEGIKIQKEFSSVEEETYSLLYGLISHFNEELRAYGTKGNEAADEIIKEMERSVDKRLNYSLLQEARLFD